MTALAKVAGAFQSKGYSRETRINQHVFYQLLDDMLGEPFDRDVANELWEQAELNSRQEAEVDQLCSIILQAQGILVDKINELTQKITDLQVQKRQRQNDPSQRSQVKSSELKQLNDQIGQLERDCDEYREDLELVTSPFGINQQNLLGGRRTVLPGNPVDYHDYSSLPHSQILSGTPNDELKWMLWLTLGLLTLELFMMYTKYDFLNLLVLVIILSIFLLNYFDTVYIKICMGLTSISIVLDLIWLMAYAGDHWSPPLNGIYSQNQTGTLRFIVLFTIIMMCAKVPLVYLLFQYRQVQPNSTYTISLLGYAKLHLTANKQHNPFTSSLGQIV